MKEIEAIREALNATSMTPWFRDGNYMNVVTPDAMAAVLAHIEEQAAEIERLRADAGRYQAVRRGQKLSVIDGIGDTLRAEQLDEAIDAAMKETS